MSAAEKALDALEAAIRAAWHHVDLRKFPYANDDFRLEALSVNLAPSLAAVARAAMPRPWWRSTGDSIWCDECGMQLGLHEPLCHEEERTGDQVVPCRYAALDAALDALEAAAEGGA